MAKFVKVVRGTERTLIADSFHKVIVEVKEGVDFKGRECRGYIVNSMFPFVWDYDRFVEVTEEQMNTELAERRRLVEEAQVRELAEQGFEVAAPEGPTATPAPAPTSGPQMLSDAQAEENEEAQE